MAEEVKHSTNIISKIHLPEEISGVKNGVTYDICDAAAIHTLEDLGLSGVLTFKGVVDVKEDPEVGKTALPTTGNEIGDVYQVKEEDVEYVWIDSNGDKTGDTWAEFGAAHDFVGTKDFASHTHSIDQATVTIGDITSTGEISGHKAKTTYLYVDTEAPTITPQATESVIKSIGSITVNAINSISSTPGTQRTGTAASWGASVTNGILSFSWTANEPSTVEAAPLVGVNGTPTDITASVKDSSSATVVTSWEATSEKATLKTTTNPNDGVKVATDIEVDSSNPITVSVTARTVSGTFSATTTGAPSQN